MWGSRNLHAGNSKPPCGHVKLGDRPRGQDGKWVRIAVFSKISKRKLGDRPQRVDFEPHAVPRSFLATKGRRNSRASPRGGVCTQWTQVRAPNGCNHVHPMDVIVSIRCIGGVCTQCTQTSPPNARNRMHPMDANETTPASRRNHPGLQKFPPWTIDRPSPGDILSRQEAPRQKTLPTARQIPPRRGKLPLGASEPLHWGELSSCSQCNRTLLPNGT